MGTIYTKQGWSIRYNVLWAFQVCSKTFYDFEMIFLQKNFFEVFEVESRGRGRDSRSKLTVPHKMGYRWNRLDLRKFKNVDRKIQNRFCPVLEPVFRIFTISKSPLVSSIWPSGNQFLHKKDALGPCGVLVKSRVIFLSCLYIGYYIRY